jgi:hypothetical protein
MAFNFAYFKKFDFGSVIKFATIDLIKQKNFLKQFFGLALISILTVVLFILFIAGLFASVYLFSVPELAVLTIVPVLFSAAFFVLLIFSMSYFSYKVLSFALSSAGKKFKKFDLKLGVQIILLGIASSFAVFFSLFELKLLLVGLVGIVLMILGAGLLMLFNSDSLMAALGVLFILVSLIPLFVYYIVLVRNSVRVSFAPLILIEKSKGIRESLKASWNLTGGKAVLIFFIQLILGGLMWVLQQIVLAPLNFASFFLPFASESVINLDLFIVFIGVLGLVFILVIMFSELVTVFGQAKTYAQMSQK